MKVDPRIEALAKTPDLATPLGIVKHYINLYKEMLGDSPLMDWLTTTDFFIAPASTKYHGASKHGLVKHSLAVLYCLDPIAEALGLQGDGVYSQEAVIAALCHDVCKVGLYKEVPKWRKDDRGKWESYFGYDVNTDLVQIGHGVESLRLIEKIRPFEKECWAQAVAWHMGTPDTWVDRQQYYHAVEKHKEVLALHTADVYASFILGY